MRPTKLANAVTKAVMPDKYQNPANTAEDTFFLMATRETISNALNAELEPLRKLFSVLDSGEMPAADVIKRAKEIFN